MYFRIYSDYGYVPCCISYGYSHSYYNPTLPEKRARFWKWLNTFTDRFPGVSIVRRMAPVFKRLRISRRGLKPIHTNQAARRAHRLLAPRPRTKLQLP